MKLTRAMMAGLLELKGIRAHTERDRWERKNRRLVASLDRRDLAVWGYDGLCLTKYGEGVVAALRALGHTAASLREGE